MYVVSRSLVQSRVLSYRLGWGVFVGLGWSDAFQVIFVYWPCEHNGDYQFNNRQAAQGELVGRDGLTRVCE